VGPTEGLGDSKGVAEGMGAGEVGGEETCATVEVARKEIVTAMNK
jgi:hypothetical protein